MYRHLLTFYNRSSFQVAYFVSYGGTSFSPHWPECPFREWVSAHLPLLGKGNVTFSSVYSVFMPGLVTSSCCTHLQVFSELILFLWFFYDPTTNSPLTFCIDWKLQAWIGSEVRDFVFLIQFGQLVSWRSEQLPSWISNSRCFLLFSFLKFSVMCFFFFSQMAHLFSVVLVGFSTLNFIVVNL